MVITMTTDITVIMEDTEATTIIMEEDTEGGTEEVMAEDMEEVMEGGMEEDMAEDMEEVMAEDTEEDTEVMAGAIKSSITCY